MTAEQMVQRTAEWYRARLGHITGSRVGDLMVAGRKKDEVFGGTAMSYIYELVGERLLDPAMVADDDRLCEWIDRAHKTTREMQWGIDHEDEARDLFAVRSGLAVERCGTYFDLRSPLGASPDGVVKDGDRVSAIVEIKTMGIKNAVAYNVLDAERLLKLDARYYWQVMAEMACTGADVGYFVVYCPDFGHIESLDVSVIARDDEAIDKMRERVRLAEAMIRQLTEQKSRTCYKFFNHEQDQSEISENL